MSLFDRGTYYFYLLLLLLLIIGSIRPLLANSCTEQDYCLGIVVSDTYITPWDIDVDPSGHSLPKGSGSYDQGLAIYNQQCIACHGPQGKGGIRMGEKLRPLPQLVNITPLPHKSIGRYWPYATTLFDYIQRAMPFYTPKSLKPDQIYALVAYLLIENNVISKDVILTNENLAEIKMPNRNGFVCDIRPDTFNLACMQDCLTPKDKGFDLGKIVMTDSKSLQADCLLLPE
ncbi:c-type cytochrome [Shewanella surugensis]|uniref:Cytochrome c n=1 Tax=Shewanella surugensis TaxID=212020 RepID=A0ABT0LFH0_9GAMM|nr:cytochrome c [Shewanella surugensis]MCL1126452.1 cytochrome c [Shewanella surugensis]